MTEPAGLREQKKRQTRLAISRAALRLTAEREYDDVTVAEIAAAAGVSRRTVSNYFPSKADCFVGVISDELLTDIAGAVFEDDHGGVRDRLASAFKRLDRQLWDDTTAAHRLASTNPEVAAVMALAHQKQCEDIVDRLVLASAGRLDALRLAVTVAAVGACVSTCITHWLSTGGRGGPKVLAELVAGSIDVLDLSWLDPHLDLLRSLPNLSAVPTQ